MKLLTRIVEGEGCIGWDNIWELVDAEAKKRGLDEDDDEGREKILAGIEKKMNTWIKDGDTIYVEFDLDKKKARVLTLKEHEAL